MKCRDQEDDGFVYHNRCSKLKITNICIAYDLILFAHGDVNLAKVIMEALEEFKGVSGLVPSIPKSMIFLCNVRDHVRTSILQLMSFEELQLMPFEEGILPIKYLGVSIISSPILYKDCNIHVERVRKRIGDWKNKLLSFCEEA